MWKNHAYTFTGGATFYKIGSSHSPPLPNGEIIFNDSRFSSDFQVTLYNWLKLLRINDYLVVYVFETALERDAAKNHNGDVAQMVRAYGSYP